MIVLFILSVIIIITSNIITYTIIKKNSIVNILKNMKIKKKSIFSLNID